MIRANQLMIGDWVLLASVPCRITELKGAGNIWPENADDTQVNDDKIEPVPLTSDFFKRNGFVDTLPMCKDIHPERTAYWMLKEDSMVMRAWSEDEELKEYVLSFGYIDDISIVVAGCCYVHELQHALKLARIPREVTL